MGYGTERLLRGLAAALVPFAVAALAATGPAHAKTRQYDLSPAPRWVQPIAVEANRGSSRNLRDGTAYLLVDRQFRIHDGWSDTNDT